MHQQFYVIYAACFDGCLVFENHVGAVGGLDGGDFVLVLEGLAVGEFLEIS